VVALALGACARSAPTVESGVGPDLLIDDPDLRVDDPDLRVDDPDLRVDDPDLRVDDPDLRVDDLDLLVDEYLALGSARSAWSWDSLLAAPDESGVGSPDLSPERFEARIEERRRLLERVRAIEPARLGRPERTDRRALIALLEGAIQDAERARTWENDPSLYLPAGRIESVFEQDPPPSDRALALLRALPAALRQGRASLRRPPERSTREAIFQTRSTVETLRSRVAALADPELIAATQQAVAELEGHLGFLEEDLLPRSDGEWAIGKQHYDATLRRRWLLDADADEILATGWEVFERTVAEAQQVAQRIEPGSDWVTVYETLKDDHPPADGLKAAYQEQMDAAQRFLIERRVVTLPEGEEVITVDTPPAMRRSSPYGTFDSVDPGDEDLQGRLVLTPIEDWLTPEQRRERLRAHHRAWIPLIAVHEAYPGHHVHALKTYENPRKLRHHVREAIFSEGWGLYTEQLMFDLGFLHGDDVKLTQLRNRLWRAARVILDVSLHTGGMTFDEAVDFLVERVRFDRLAAELEVGMYVDRPTYVLGYLIGMLEIDEMCREWIERHGAPAEPRELYDALLRIGSLPPALVRAELLGEEPPA
jgi:uncharacterized protein (DUF885 family)